MGAKSISSQLSINH